MRTELTRRCVQWVWWGLFDWAFFFERLDPQVCTMGHIYSWLLRVGPIEIRKWRRKHPKVKE